MPFVTASRTLTTIIGFSAAASVCSVGLVLALTTVGGGATRELWRDGSVAAPDRTMPEDDAAEHALLAPRATVDEALARRVALAHLGPGHVQEAELEAEDGFVVWEVEIRDDRGRVREALVDAGAPMLLAIERDDAEA